MMSVKKHVILYPNLMEAVKAAKFSRYQSWLCFLGRLKKNIARAGKFLSGKPFAVMIVLVVFAGVFGYTLPSLAADVFTEILNGTLDALFRPIAIFICALLYAIAGLVQYICILLMHILTTVAQYNKFVGARPVELGWPLVRDVVNMFFIVVLLVMAFSTIVGYEPFHYKKHLPKLLLMAILINFSKTLIGLLIDFSQVITLTFVNGFKQAAFGNFVKGFQITEIMKVAVPPLGDISGEIMLTLGKTLVTLIFAIAVFSIIATVLLIMVIYFVVRIVMLWMLLILSPIAFFALALPAKLQNAVKAFTQDWWKQLGAFLTGGPIVAFFLWLALATIQGAAKPFDGMYRGEAQESTDTMTIISAIASTDNLTTLIVCIVMLLGGLKIAVSVSGEVSPKLGAIAGKIKAAGGPAGLMGRGVGKVAKFGAKTAMTAVQARYGGKIGGLGSQLTGAAAKLEGRKGALGILARPAGALLGKGAATLGAVPGKAMALERTKIGEQIKGQSAQDMRTILQGKVESGKNSGNQALENAAKLELAKLAASPADFLNLKNQGKEDYYKKSGANRNDPAAQELAESHALAQARRIAAENMEEGKKAAVAIGDTETITRLTEAMRKDPSKYSDQKDILRDLSEKISDPARLLREIQVSAFQDTGVTTAYFQSAELIDESGRFKAGYKDSPAYQEFIKNPERRKYAEVLEQKMESKGGPEDIVKLVAAGKIGAGDTEKNLANSVRQIISQTNDGRMILSSRAENMVKPAEIFGGGKVEIKNFAQLIGGLGTEMQEKFKEALRGAGLGDDKFNNVAMHFNHPLSEKQGSFLSDKNNIRPYVSPPQFIPGQPPSAEAAKALPILVQGQALGIPAPKGAEAQVANYALTEAGSANPAARIQGAMAVANINTEILSQTGPDRDALIESLTNRIDSLAGLYRSADSGTKKKMEEVILKIHTAAEKTKGLVEKVGAGLPEIDQKLINISDQIRKSDTLNQVGKRRSKGQRG